MVNDEILYIRRRLKKKMDEDRFEHTIGVAYTSVCLAMRYGEDLHKAELAGLLHDCAKCIPDDIKGAEALKPLSSLNLSNWLCPLLRSVTYC